MNLILIGHKSSGKTTIGKMLAKTLNCHFIDTDELIQKTYDNNKSIADIYHELGEEKFRALESQVVQMLCTPEEKNKSKITNDNSCYIIATGGGVVFNEINLELLRQTGIFIYLKTNYDTLIKRNQQRHQHGILAKQNDQEKAYLERDKLYQKYANFIVESDKMSLNQIVQNIITRSHHGQ